MKTNRVSLELISESDYPTLFKWRNSPDFREFVHYIDSEVLFTDFVKEFQNNSKVRPFQYVIKKVKTGEPIGLIFTHTFSSINRYCFINIYINDENRIKGYGPESLSLLSVYLFEEKDIFKIYLESFEHNNPSLNAVRSFGFKEEGRFKEHRLIGNKRFDVIRFAVYRDSLPKFKRIIDHFSKTRE